MTSTSSSSSDKSVILATAGYDHSIRFWDAPTGRVIRTFQHLDSQCNALAVSNDKRLLAAAGNARVRLFELATSSTAPITNFEGHTGNVTAVGFQRERRWMYTGGEDGSVRVWDVRAPGEQRCYVGQSPVNSVVLHPNQGELLSCDDDGVLRVWDLTMNKCSLEFVPQQPSAILPKSQIALRSITIASDASMMFMTNNRGQLFACSYSQNAVEASEGQQVVTRMSHVIENGCALDLHEQNQFKTNSNRETPIISTSAQSDSSNKRHDPNQSSSSSSITLLHTFQPHNTYCLKALLSPDVRTLATCSADKSIKLWNVQPKSRLSSEKSTTDSIDGNFDSHVLPDAEKQGTITNSLELDRILSGHTAWVWDLSFSADSAYLVSASSDKTAKLWDVHTGEIILEYKGHQKAITAIALNDAS